MPYAVCPRGRNFVVPVLAALATIQMAHAAAAATAEEVTIHECHTDRLEGQCGKFCEKEEVGTWRVYRMIGYRKPKTETDVYANVWGTGPFWWRSYADEAVYFAGVLGDYDTGYVNITCVPTPPSGFASGAEHGVTSKALALGGTWHYDSTGPLIMTPGAFSLERYYDPTPEPTPAPTPGPTPEPTSAPTPAPTPHRTHRPPSSSLLRRNDPPQSEGSLSRGDNDNEKVDSHMMDFRLPLGIAFGVLGVCCALLFGVLVARGDGRKKRGGAGVGDLAGETSAVLAPCGSTLDAESMMYVGSEP